MLTDLIIIVCSVALILLAIYVVKLRKQNATVADLLNRAILDRHLLMEKLSDALDALEKKPVEQTDGFLKFLEESRGSAFTFIELLQSSIVEFDNNTKEVFETSRYKDVKEIKKAFDVLKSKTLPNDVPNN